MNDAMHTMLTDLKDFIEARFTQSEARTDARLGELEKNMDSKIEALRQKMHEGFAGVADAMEETNKVVDARLTRLERHVGLA